MKVAGARRGAVLAVSIAVVMLLLIACRSTLTSVAPELTRLQGQWECHGPGGPCSVTILGDALRFQSRPDFWYETTFTLPAADGPRQLHATIVKDSSAEQAHIGTVVVAIYKFEDGALTLGVVEDFEGPPNEAIVADWEWIFDIFELERAGPGLAGPSDASVDGAKTREIDRVGRSPSGPL